MAINNFVLKTTRFNSYSLVMFLFSLNNILELFLPRENVEHSTLRLPVQLISVLILFIMWFSLVTRKLHWVPVTKNIALFIFLILVYFWAYFFSNYDYNFNNFSPYLKLLSWLTAVIFFYEMMLIHDIYIKQLRVYSLTLISSIIKQIYESALFDNDKLGGGDTAALPLIFIIPIVLIVFHDNLKIIVLLIIAGLIFLSLRRTAIICFVLCTPFYFKNIKSELKSYQIGIFCLLIVTSFYFIWMNLGNLIMVRFNEMFEGSDGAYGSGRSDFYNIVWKEWAAGSNSIFFGNGLLSLRKMFASKAEFPLTHAHNDILEILYTFGLIGLVLYLIVIASIWRLKYKLKKIAPFHLSLLYMIIISYLIISLASGTLLRITTMPFSLSVAYLLYIINKKQLLQTKFFSTYRKFAFAEHHEFLSNNNARL